MTRLRAERSEGRIPAGARKCPLLQNTRNDSGAHSASYSMGTEGLSKKMKRPGREVYRSSSTSAEIKEWSSISFPLRYFYCGQGQLYFFFLPRPNIFWRRPFWLTLFVYFVSSSKEIYETCFRLIYCRTLECHLQFIAVFSRFTRRLRTRNSH